MRKYRSVCSVSIGSIRDEARISSESRRKKANDGGRFLSHLLFFTNATSPRGHAGSRPSLAIMRGRSIIVATKASVMKPIVRTAWKGGQELVSR